MDKNDELYRLDSDEEKVETYTGEKNKEIMNSFRQTCKSYASE